MAGDRLTILFSGMIGADPWQGGATWAVLQYVLGLRQLGHEVYFVEPIKSASLRPAGTTLAESDNAAYFRSVTAEFGLVEHSALLLEGTRDTVGLPYEQLRSVAKWADVLFNVSGMLTDPALLGPVATRVYLDLDPAFVQLWHAQGIDMRFAGHTHFVTVGRQVGQPDCPVPTCGLNWLSTAQPVVLTHWPAKTSAGDRHPVQHDGLTTIANWRGYGSVEHEGRFYGQKAHSLRPFIDLPTRTREPFMPALAIHPGETKDLEALHRNGWRLLDPARVAGTPGDYRRFVQGSKAEFGIAKSGYVVSRCGWFSDRSACYLASSRLVIAQDTAFAHWLPTGRGLFSFQTADDVLAAIDTINADYAGHCKAARELAEAYFDSDRVLPRLLGAVSSAG